MRKLSALAAAVVLVLACGDDDPSGPSGHGPQTGDWTGWAPSGEPLAFTVTEDSITGFEMTVIHTVDGAADTVVWQVSAMELVGDSTFSGADSIDEDSVSFGFTVSGGFTASDSAQGSWSSTAEWEIGGGSGVDDLGGSWTASPSDG